MSDNDPSRYIFGFFAIVVGLIGNSVTAYSYLPYLDLPEGTAIRPMNHAVFLILVFAGTFAATFPSAVLAFVKGQKALGLAAGLLAVLPWPLSYVLFWAIVDARGLLVD